MLVLLYSLGKVGYNRRSPAGSIQRMVYFRQSSTLKRQFNDCRTDSIKVDMTNIKGIVYLPVTKKITGLHKFRQSFRFCIQTLFSPVVYRELFQNVFYRNH